MCCLVLLLYRSSFFFFLLFRPPPKSTLFPYTTLFRSTGTGQWGTEYDRSKDLGRVSVASRPLAGPVDRKSTRLNSSHANISYAVFCLKKKKKKHGCSTEEQTMIR